MGILAVSSLNMKLPDCLGAADEFLTWCCQQKSTLSLHSISCLISTQSVQIKSTLVRQGKADLTLFFTTFKAVCQMHVVSSFYVKCLDIRMESPVCNYGGAVGNYRSLPDSLIMIKEAIVFKKINPRT